MQTIYHSLRLFLGHFLNLTDAEFDLLKLRSLLKHFQKNEKLMEPGQTEQHLYFIGKGMIREFFYKGEKEVTTDIITEGTITGSVSSFLTSAPSHYCLKAMEPVTALAISKNDLEELYQSNRNWERLGRVLTTHFLLQQEQHILDNIRLSVRERFIQFAEQHKQLLQRVPQKYLASYLNIKPETFSRLKHLVKSSKKAGKPSRS
ncbi:MAG: Crp/Fnr family transcriptional regulator [Bacteroidota bacterium]